MSCSCIKGNYNFYIQHLGCAKIIYTDLSVWMDDTGYEIPETYTIDITLPGRTTAVSVDVNTKGVTEITPADIGLKGSSFPDGIYCFSTTSCDNIYTRYRANTCELECCLDNFLVTIPEYGDYDLVYMMDMHIRAIHTLAERDAVEKAKKQYSIAQKLVKNLNCNCK